MVDVQLSTPAGKLKAYLDIQERLVIGKIDYKSSF
jgi:hypothetical protein